MSSRLLVATLSLATLTAAGRALPCEILVSDLSQVPVGAGATPTNVDWHGDGIFDDDAHAWWLRPAGGAFEPTVVLDNADFTHVIPVAELAPDTDYEAVLVDVSVAPDSPDAVVVERATFRTGAGRDDEAPVAPTIESVDVVEVEPEIAVTSCVAQLPTTQVWVSAGGVADAVAYRLERARPDGTFGLAQASPFTGAPAAVVAPGARALLADETYDAVVTGVHQYRVVAIDAAGNESFAAVDVDLGQSRDGGGCASTAPAPLPSLALALLFLRRRRRG